MNQPIENAPQQAPTNPQQTASGGAAQPAQNIPTQGNTAQQGYYAPYGVPYGAPYPYYPQPPKKKKVSAGLIVLICLLSACLILSTAVLAFTLFRNASSSAQEGEESPSAPYSEDYDSLNDNALKPGVDSGHNDLKIIIQKPKGKALSAAAIAKQSQKSVVGVSVYSTNGVLQGEASGVVAGTDSKQTKTYVITCAHVIEDDANRVFKIVDANDKEYLAAVIGYDIHNDIAVLSVEKTGFAAAQFGNSALLTSGETVVAIGNPGGSEFYGSVTQGIVSATDRMMSVDNQTIACIQHDAAINPGSSGGALFNRYGQVIGINYSKVALDDYEGMNFSIPSNKAVEVANKIIAKGIKTRGAKLGIEYYVAASYFDENYKQLVIGSIDPKSDLYQKAQEGDFIIAVNAKKITDKYMIVKLINEKEPGDTITLTIAHKNEKTGKYETKDVTVKLIEK